MQSDRIPKLHRLHRVHWILGGAVLVGTTLVAILLFPSSNATAANPGVVFPPGSIYADSNPITVPFLEQQNNVSRIEEWKKHDK